VTRPNRVLVEGGVYHVYNRLGRGERVFDQEAEAAAFVGLLHDVVARDGLTVFAWALMSNYFHLAVRIVDDPAEYRWSGHREFLGKVREPIVDADEVLRVVGEFDNDSRSGVYERAQRIRRCARRISTGRHRGTTPPRTR